MAKKQKDEKPDLQDDLEAALLLKDADEALRQERMEALWREWGSTIIGVALMIVFGTMLGVGWKSWRSSVHQGQTAQIIDASETGVAGLLASKDELSGHYGGVAALLAAGNIANQTEEQTLSTAKIIHDLMVDADKAGLPRQYDILARWGQLRTKADIEDSIDIRLETADEMMNLADKRGNPYQTLMMVEAAVIYGENGQATRAVEILNDVSEMNATNADDGLTDMVNTLTRLYETDIVLLKKDNADE
jgi:hypothetical protein